MEARQKAEEGTSERDKQRARELRDEVRGYVCYGGRVVVMIR